MPLASLLVAAGSSLFGPGSWAAGRSGFLLVAVAVPPLTAALAWSFTSRRDLAIASGLLAVFSAFYLPFLPITDTFGLYMVLGGTFFLLISRLRSPLQRMSILIIPFLLGVIAGLMHLTRADGLLWLLIAFLGIIFFRNGGRPWRVCLISFIAVLVGYLAIMAPWFVRNYFAFGSPLGPGGTKMLWMTDYDQLFIFPASRLTPAAWWQSGIASILNARLWALGVNLERTLAEQGEIFLLPFIVIGLWQMRREARTQLAGLAWLLTFAAMTFVFPFAGARGGFFHSGAALQPVWWSVAPIGFDGTIEWASRKRGWDAARAGRLFRPALVGLAVLLSAGVIWLRLVGVNNAFPDHANQVQPLSALLNARQGELWSQENYTYGQIYQSLLAWGITPDDIIMVANPPGFYLASGHPAIAVPDGDPSILKEVAQRYNARYLVLEEGSIPADLAGFSDHLEQQTGIMLKGEVVGARIYIFNRP